MAPNRYASDIRPELDHYRDEARYWKERVYQAESTKLQLPLVTIEVALEMIDAKLTESEEKYFRLAWTMREKFAAK